MDVVVLLKQVADSYQPIDLDLASGQLATGSTDRVANEIDERALAFALGLVADGGTVTAVTLGPERAVDTLRRALATGADRGIHILTPQGIGLDAGGTASAIASALEALDFDLVVAGDRSSDGQSGAIPAMLAELLRLPQLTHLHAASVEGGAVTGERVTENAVLTVRGTLPAVVSVTEKIAEPRHPNFKGIMAAKSKAVTVVPLDDLPPHSGGRWKYLSATEREERGRGRVITDDGTATTQIVEFLVEHDLVAKE
jgi:electron transfer flavoprotein beta subunit